MSRTYIKYYHYATLSIDQVLSHVGNSSNHNSIEVNGMNINCYSDRLQTFKLSGTTCHFCGLKALFFTVSEQLSPKSKLPSAHFNLWGYSNGEFVLFTADHIMVIIIIIIMIKFIYFKFTIMIYITTFTSTFTCIFYDFVFFYISYIIFI